MFHQNLKSNDEYVQTQRIGFLAFLFAHTHAASCVLHIPIFFPIFLYSFIFTLSLLRICSDRKSRQGGTVRYVLTVLYDSFNTHTPTYARTQTHSFQAHRAKECTEQSLSKLPIDWLAGWQAGRQVSSSFGPDWA